MKGVEMRDPSIRRVSYSLRYFTIMLALITALVMVFAFGSTAAARDEGTRRGESEPMEELPRGEELREMRRNTLEKLRADGNEVKEEGFNAAWAEAAAAGWDTPYQVSPGDFSMYWWPSMDTDTAGNLHMVYMDPIIFDVFYTSNQGGSWSPPISVIGNDLYGMCPDIFVDDWNNVHIAYMTTDMMGEDKIHAVSRWGNTWGPVQNASGADDDCWLPSLVRESGPGSVNSELHVTYADYDGMSIYIKHNQTTGGAWNAAAIVASGADDDCDYPSLAIDGGDGLHLAYEYWDGGGNAHIQYNNKPYGGAWGAASENASNGEIDAEYPSLVVDAAGEPYVTYTWFDTGSTDITIRHNHRTGGVGWDVPITASGADTLCTSGFWWSPFGFPMRGSRFAYDPVSGGLYVSYPSMDASGTLRMKANYYNPVGGYGVPETVLGVDQNMQTDIAVDPSGTPHVAWVHQDQLFFPNDLYLSTRAGPGSWSVPMPVPSETTAVLDTDCVVDIYNTTHVAAWEYSGGAHRVNYHSRDAVGNWSDGVRISGNDKGCVFPKIAVDQNGNAHVCYVSLDWGVPFLPVGNQVRYTAETNGWSAPITISGADMPDGEAAIAVDNSGIAHVAYNDDNLLEMHYVDNASGWSAPVAIPGGDTGGFLVNAACDTSNTFHVVYPDWPKPGDWRIRYASRSSSGTWNSATTISAGEPDTYAPDIVARSDNTLDVAYVADTGSGDFNVRHTTMPAGGAWSTPQTLGTDSDCSEPSLAADSLDQLHLFYEEPYSNLPCRLRYMKHDGSSWSGPETAAAGIEPVSFLIEGPLCSAGVSPDGVPCSVYEDGASLFYVRESAQPTAYFAEGFTGGDFQEFLCLANPQGADIQSTITYMFTDGTTQAQDILVPAQSRVTVDVNSVVGPDREVSAKVESNGDIAAERPMYFDYGDGWDGGHVVKGAPWPAINWFFAEGYTGEGFDEYICVLNPGDYNANLTFRFQTQSEGEKVISDYMVEPHSRVTFRVNDLLGSDYQTSLKLESDRPIVAERPMYFDYQGANGDRNWQGGHCVMGAAFMSNDYYFAEGTTRGGFEEWLTIQNPGASDINVDATYYLGEGQGAPVAKSYDVPANSRRTVYVPSEVGADKDVSAVLTSNSRFLAERPMYFDYHNGFPGGHCVIGTPYPSAEWLFAEGYTGDSNEFSEWLCLQNPGNTDAQVQITYYTQEAGVLPPKDLVLPAGTRMTISVDQQIGPNLQVSSRIISDQPIVAERAMYFDYDGWRGGHAEAGY
jgi:hypothetical protein